MSLITIDQLLESVDLDFEPRWVTKGRSGYVEIWSNKPKAGATTWYHIGEDTIYQSICKLKLSEFDGKDWTECIYEVPRKTTTDSKKELVGKIEKFDYPVSSPFYIEHNIIMDKINELVDAVNELKGAKND